MRFNSFSHLLSYWAKYTPEAPALRYGDGRWSYEELYREVLRRMDLAPEDCLMVGNDVGEDMVAAQLGMQVFLLTDHMINKAGTDISVYPHGGFDELLDHLKEQLERG